MGGLLAFRVANFNNTAEREQFRFLCERLKGHYENSNDICVLAGNYNIGCELDALFIKKDAIIVIEFKNYGGKVIANENGEWTCDGKAIKGGSRKTVLQQALTNHSIVKRELKALGVSSKNIKDLPTLIVFNQSVEVTNRLSATTKSWLHIVDNEHFIDKLDDITCPRTDMNPLDIVNLAELLNLNPFFLPEFSNAVCEQTPESVKINDLSGVLIDKSTENGKGPQSIIEDELCLNKFVANDEESVGLSKFAEQIVKQSLKLGTFSVKVLDGVSSHTVFASYGINISHKYVVTVSADGINEYCAKLSKFVHYDVRPLSPKIIFWEYGEVLSPEPDVIVDKVDVRHEGVIFRKSRTTLPHWLDRKIYNDLHAIYAPDHERYEYNLDLNDDELKVYLGTYFPRSYAEMFCIADNLLQNKSFAELLDYNEINFMDCGCGTGGEILGLITAIGKHLPQAKINITAIDGNEGALAILADVVECFPNRSIQVRLTTLSQTLCKEEDLAELGIGKGNYHFILCDKMVSELISKKVLPSNAFAIMATNLAPQLHENGLLIILDVTTKDKRTGFFYPQLMNSALNDYVRTNRSIETLLPLSCACNVGCKDFCFIQQTFSISHSHKSNDESRVCYRILCREPLKTAVMQGAKLENMAYVIDPIKFRQNDGSAVCRQTKDNKTPIDTFNINL